MRSDRRKRGDGVGTLPPRNDPIRSAVRELTAKVEELTSTLNELALTRTTLLNRLHGLEEQLPHLSPLPEPPGCRTSLWTRHQQSCPSRGDPHEPSDGHGTATVTHLHSGQSDGNCARFDIPPGFVDPYNTDAMISRGYPAYPPLSAASPACEEGFQFLAKLGQVGDCVMQPWHARLTCSAERGCA